VVGFEEIESERRFWAVEGCRIPTHTEELAVVLVGNTTCTAFAKHNLYFVPTVDVDDGELTTRGDRRARGTVVSKVADVPK